MQALVQDLNFPTSVALAPDGTLYVAESGLPFDGAPKGGRVSRIGPGGSVQPLVTELRQPLNGLLWYRDSLIIAEGGYPGRILRYVLEPGRGAGELKVLVDDLPGFGNYQTNMVAVGPDGKLYFSQGAMTNSGIIGPDSNDLAWLRVIEHHPDIPGYTIELASQIGRFTSPEGKTTNTGGFARFGSAHAAGTRIPGRTPCTAAVMRCNLDGSELELFAWGLRNAYGLGFLEDGRLVATDQGADARGTRPVWNCPDFLYEVKQGAWYGWPDFYGGIPITDRRYRDPDGIAQAFLLQNHAELPPPQAALLEFPLNACAVKFARVPPPHRFAGDLLVAWFGDERPMTGPPGPKVGRNLARVRTRDWSLHLVPELSFKRPLDVAFAPDGQSFYVVDFGEFEFTEQKSIRARAGSGCLWKIPVEAMERT
jgi:glucose/arabinose dehydrogenase